MCADSVLCHVIGCECVRVSFPSALTVPVYRPRSPTTCAIYLSTEYCLLGNKTIPLVSKSSHTHKHKIIPRIKAKDDDKHERKHKIKDDNYFFLDDNNNDDDDDDDDDVVDVDDDDNDDDDNDEM